jgi:ABC-2 type transport system ATP-binding protein
MLLGLVRPSAGAALIGGRPYPWLPHPRRTAGAVLEATGAHPGRRARDHLRILAQVTGVPDGRVAEVCDQVGLAEPAHRRVGGYSLGMRQRLGLAGALLGDPPVLLLDEPANGLDPAGMAWLRGLLRDLADEGRTILVSSHHPERGRPDRRLGGDDQPRPAAVRRPAGRPRRPGGLLPAPHRRPPPICEGPALKDLP